MSAALTAAGCAAAALAGVRWLRVAQREHYLPGSVVRFGLRWWRLPPNVPLAALAVAAAALMWRWPPFGLVAAAAAAVGPLGLGLRGRTSRLAWTRRLRTLAAVAAVLGAAALGLGWLAGRPGEAAVLVALAVPLGIDLSLGITAPLETRLRRRWVDRAARKLAEVAPRVVAITGSYGKTTTKRYVAHLLRGSCSVLETPASFNNELGLARAINEHLNPGVDVFVAELGTYGPGEIRDLCGWVTPEVAVITAIGPVHLERMGSLDVIAAAKAEILERARAAVLNVDVPRLRQIAEGFPGRVIRCSAQSDADVCVRRSDGRLAVRIGELERELDAPGTVHPGNLACALGAALAIGGPPAALLARLDRLPGADHRLELTRAPSGVLVIDDTFNANPAGARAALDLLRRSAGAGRRAVVVTPGMVELGPVQDDENARFAREAAEVATDLVVVGRTNKAALLDGAARGTASVRCVGTRDEAASWVRAGLRAGDVVLYENDLPDHFP